MCSQPYGNSVEPYEREVPQGILQAKHNYESCAETHPMKQPDPYKIVEILRDAGVPFVIIGGLSVIHHGYIRTTEDADIVFKRSEESEEALCKAFAVLDACWISDEKDPSTGMEKLVPVSASYIKAEHLMMLCTNHGFLDAYDYIPGFPGVSVDELFETAESRDGMLFTNLEWLLKMKKKAGRDKDKDDALKLAHIKSD